MRITWALLFVASTAQAAITGTLIDTDGKPIAGATVQAFPAESSQALRARLLSSSPDRVPLTTVQSGENGSFSIDPKTPLADLAVIVGGRLAAGVELPDGEDAGVMILPAEASRRIQVLADGKPVANALVAAGPFTARTNGSGNADLPEISSATVRVTVLQSEFAPQEEFVAESTSARTKINLTRGTAVRGKVVAPDGSPVEHAVISIGGWPLAESNAAGEFTIAHAPANARAVMATRNDRAGAVPNKAGAITIHLGPAVSISGVLRDSASGRGVTAARVVALQPPDPFNESVITDSKGSFALPPLVGGRYMIAAMHPAYAFTEAQVDAQKSMSKSIEARPLARISGRVIDEKRQPVPAALVWFGMRAVPLGSNATAAGPGGEFTLRGNFTSSFPQPVMAAKNGYAVGTSGPLSADSAKSRLTITLPHGFPLAVQVVDKRRQAVPGASVNVLAAMADSMVRYPVLCERALSNDCRFTDASGSSNYRLVEGSYVVQVRGDTIASKTLPAQTLTARSSPLTIEVDQGVEVSGRVVYGDGTAVTGAMVMARNSFSNMNRPSADGTFTLRGLAAGPVALVVRLQNNLGLEAATKDVTAPAHDVTITLPTPARVEGRVFDKVSRQPIADFSVSATQRDIRFGGLQRPEQVHSEGGTFALDRVPVGAIAVRVTAAGYAPGSLNDITTEEGKSVTGLEIPLERGAKITGRVTAGDQPLSGVLVRMGSTAFRGPFDPNATTTDTDGEYVVDGVAAGERMLEFVKQGYVSKHKSIDVTAGKDARLDVTLDRGRDLTGRVVDSGGQAISGARLWFSAVARPTPMPNIFSDAEGQFKFEGLADGRYTVHAIKDGYVNASVEADVPSSTPLVVTLKSGGTITGRVVGLNDSELSTVTVFANGSASNAHAQVEPGGTFTIRGVPDGRIMVSANVSGSPSRRSASKVVDVSEGTAPPVEIDFNQGVTVTGHVTQSGVPVSGGNVNFSPKTRGDAGGSSQINSDGSYAVSGLPSGDFIVRVFTYNGVQYQTDYSVTGNGTFDIDMKGATLHGHAVDAATGEAVSDARVWIEPNKDMKVSQNTMTDSEGKFLLTAIPDGTIALRATREKYSPVSQTVVVASGTAPDVELRFDRGQESTIRIFDAENGAPMNGFVSVMSGRKNVGAALPGDDGVMHIWLAPGTYRASVSAPDYVPSTVNLIVPGPEVRVSLSHGGTLVITSRSGGDVRIGLAGFPLEMSGVGGTVKRMIHLNAGVPSRAGTLQPGRYTVELLATDRVTVKQSYSIDIVAGQTAQLNID